MASLKLLFVIGILVQLSNLTPVFAQEDEDVKKNLIDIFGTPDQPKTGDDSPKAPIDKSGVADTTTSKLDLSPIKNDGFTTCIKEDRTSGICVLYYQCDQKTKELITDGESLIDVRMGGCPNYFHVCCSKSEVNTTKPTVTTHSDGKPVTPARNPEQKWASCGYSRFDDDESFRIVNDGTKAEFLEFPWMVALLRKKEANEAWSQNDFLGGGSLIHKRVVMTAAHKVDGIAADEVKCRAGEWDTQNTDEIYPYQEMDVAKIIRHKDFYRPSVLNSIALLILKEDYMAMPNVGIGCLGVTMPEPGTKCWTMGWGKNDFNKNDAFAVILKKIELPLVSRRNCELALRRTRLGSFFRLHESLTCAGGEEGRDACSNDGGAPLVCSVGDPKDYRYAIYGMVAYGIGCGDEGIPGVYVDTVYFNDWISEKMKEEGFGIESV